MSINLKKKYLNKIYIFEKNIFKNIKRFTHFCGKYGEWLMVKYGNGNRNGYKIVKND